MEVAACLLITAAAALAGGPSTANAIAYAIVIVTYLVMRSIHRFHEK